MDFQSAACAGRSCLRTSTCAKPMPRAFAIDPTGTFIVVGNQNSDAIATFRIDPAKGTLTATGHTASVGKPVSFEFVR